jgi:hypothetical protein
VLEKEPKKTKKRNKSGTRKQKERGFPKKKGDHQVLRKSPSWKKSEGKRVACSPPSLKKKWVNQSRCDYGAHLKIFRL